jgi:hypothetical protein
MEGKTALWRQPLLPGKVQRFIPSISAAYKGFHRSERLSAGVVFDPLSVDFSDLSIHPKGDQKVSDKAMAGQASFRELLPFFGKEDRPVLLCPHQAETDQALDRLSNCDLAHAQAGRQVSDPSFARFNSELRDEFHVIFGCLTAMI